MLAFLPSLLNTWQLPGLAAGAISSALGKRILLFLLKRTLGHFIKDNDIKLDQVDAPSFGGKLEVRGVHLDAEAITKLLPDAPVRVESGLVGSIIIQLPWPNLWKGDLTITISDLDLHLVLDQSAKGSREANLHESLVSVAEDTLHQDSELEESIQASIIEDNDLNSAKATSANGYIAGIVDSLLTRLKVSLKNSKISIAPHNNRRCEMQIRIKAMQAGTELQQTTTLINVTRTASFDKVELYLCNDEVSDRDDSHDIVEDADDSESESNYMEMSQAIPDLRSSQAALEMFHSTISGGAESMYSSAIGSHAVDNDDSSQAMMKAKDASPLEYLLFGSGNDPIVATFVMTRSLATSEVTGQYHEEDINDFGSAISPLKMNISLRAGNVVGFLTPNSLCGILRFLDDSVSVLNVTNDSQEAVPTSRYNSSIDEAKLQSGLSTSLYCSSLDFVCAYEDIEAYETTMQKQYIDSLQAYWTRPSRFHPHVGHLRLRMQEMQYNRLKGSSTDTRFARVQIGDLAIYEHLSPILLQDDTNISSILPLFLFDHNLSDTTNANKSSSRERLRSQMDSFKDEEEFLDCIDWRFVASSSEFPQRNNTRPNPYWRTSYGDRGWKVRPKHHRRSSSISANGQEVSPVFDASIDEEGVKVSLAPLHVFVDLSLVNRIMPLLLKLGDVARKEVTKSIESDSTASFETLHQASVNLGRFSSEIDTLYRLDLTCSLIRLEIRIPDSTPQMQSRGGYQLKEKRSLGLKVRAGILVIDAQQLYLGRGQDTTEHVHKMAVHFGDSQMPTKLLNGEALGQKDIAKCTIDRISIFYKPVGDQRAISFASIEMMTSDQEQIEASLRPRLQVLQHESHIPIGSNISTRCFVDCKLPLVQFRISKQLLDGLELIADDFSLWMANLSETGNERFHSENANEALKILGSRFFGSARQSFTALSGSSASMELVQKTNPTPAFSLGIDDVFITLIVPRKNFQEKSRRLRLKVSDIKALIDTKHGPRSTLMDATILSFSLDDLTDTSDIRNLVKRSLEPSMSRATLPMLSFQLLSTSDVETSYRESQCDLMLQSLTITFDGNITLLDDLLVFSKSPEGAFEHVEPNEVTRLTLRLRDLSLLVSPPTCDARAALLIGDLIIRTKLMSDARKTIIRGQVSDTSVYLVEKYDEEEQNRLHKVARTSSDYWNHLGFAKTIMMSSMTGSVMLSSLTRPEIDIKLSKMLVEVLVCADTLQMMDQIYKSVMPEEPSTTTNTKPRVLRVGKTSSDSSTTDSSDGRDLLASLDEGAFRQAKPLSSIPDLLEDDLPSDADFLERGKVDLLQQRDGDAAFQTLESEVFLDEDEDEEDGEDEKEKAVKVTKDKRSENVVFKSEVVTIRLLDCKGILPKQKYLTSLQHSSDEENLGQQLQVSSLRIRAEDFDFIFRIFGGYDCETTRNAVEEEVKRVKRRLQKIKQMLDQGQTPDDSVEEATAALMESIHIPLPIGASAGDMEAAEMIQAMEGEFGDESETASTASTWKQFIPGNSASATSLQQQKTRRKRSKLARSKKSMIDVELRGLTLEYDQYAPKDLLSSRLLLQSDTLQILDNIKTSTWKTFLTSMASNHPISTKYAKEMVKIELIHVRPAVEAQTEIRCRARLAPLRLHIDQDALDFIKKFAAFRPPNALPDPPSSPSSRVEPFIQHAEVFPIRIKLDYKPKRVDYNLLREGKTIEMMNFFNFEGSEMTLRHVTIRGISGWGRFFETLQDIWTPDVKSNQLADVLSGISPIRSLVNVGNGVADLILLPIEHYQRDGRLGKGLKAGAKSFVKSTMLEAARIGARLATGTQVILEQTESALAGRRSSSDEVVAGTRSNTRKSKTLSIQDDRVDDRIETSSESEEEAGVPISRYANQPGNFMQALTEAQEDLTKGFNSAAQTILAVPMEVYERRGGEGGSRPVVRAVPIAILKSAAGASGAVSKTLQGIQRGLTGISLEEEEDKYKRTSRSTSK